MKFESNKGEKIFGMGQYQQDCMDLKGCVLELAQRNSNAPNRRFRELEELFRRLVHLRPLEMKIRTEKEVWV